MPSGWLSSETGRSVVPLAALLALLAAWRAGVLGTTADGVLTDVSYEGLNVVSLDKLTQNYYEVAMDVDRGLGGDPGGIRAALASWLDKGGAGGEDENWVRIGESGLTRELDGFLRYELLPDVDVIFKGARVKSNRWGQRDRDYELVKPPGTFRIALVGGSNTMGAGVELEETYAELVEERLNRELASAGPEGYQRYEIINFSVGGYQLLERLYVARYRIPAFDPDLILVVVTMHDMRWGVHRTVADRIHDGRDLHFDFLEEITDRAGANPGDSKAKLRQRLRRYSGTILSQCFRELKTLERELDVPVATLILRLRVYKMDSSVLLQAELAEQEGLAALRIVDAYDGRSEQEMYLRKTDKHPTPAAHALIAEELYDKMLADPKLGPLVRGNDQGYTR